jgi:hypothetical protein
MDGSESEIPINTLLWTLAQGAITKLEDVENMDVRTCYNWYYNMRVTELNEMIPAIKRLREAKE